MEQEQWIGLYRYWTSAEQRQLIKLYYDEKSIDDIAKELGRESLEVVLKLIELRILGTDELARVWNNYERKKKAA